MLSHRQIFLNNLAQTSSSPLLLEIVSAEGIYLKDVEGKKYVDLISGIGVSNIGHRHPTVVKAIKSQVDKYLHVMVYGEYIQSPQVLLSESLLQTLPKGLDSIYLVNSGSEGIEGAMKLAKRYSGKFQFISCKDAYHGSSQGALSLTGNETLKRNYRPLLPEISHINFGDLDDLEQITTDTAAFIVETIQGEAGIRQANKFYWQAVRKQCDKTGTLLILDEVQCGFARTGKFWAFEHYGIQPDILVSAKGMGGGMPIGCFISSKKIMSVLTENPVLGHISTFGGHPISAVASYSTLEVIKKERLMDGVFKKEQLFHTHLKHPKIKQIRSKGLMIAVEFESYNVLKPIINRSIELGVVTDWFLFNDYSMRIAPPLIITEKEIKETCKIILQAIEDFCNDGIK